MPLDARASASGLNLTSSDGDNASATSNTRFPSSSATATSGAAPTVRSGATSSTIYHETAFRRHRSPLHLFAESLLERTRQAAQNVDLAPHAGNALAVLEGMTGPGGSLPASTTSVSAPATVDHNRHVFVDNISSRMKRYYRLKLAPWISFKVTFDRLTLLHVLDRNPTLFENLLSVFLAVLVGFFSAMVLNQGHYQDLWIFLFCAVTASCQYSLLKSVQPDSSSPTHGFNRVVVFSRPAYFILCCALVLALQRVTECEGCFNSFNLYGMSFPTKGQVSDRGIEKQTDIFLYLSTFPPFQVLMARDIVYSFILFFPVIFVLGLLPQINTFLMYLLEQVDIHLLGGNATSSLLSAIYCVVRSLVAISIVIGFAYGGLTGNYNTTII